MRLDFAALSLLAIAPQALGGARLRGDGPARDAWLAALRALLPTGQTWQRWPAALAGCAESELDGSLDLQATLAAQRPVMSQGPLARARGGVALLPMAERTPTGVAARLAQALDEGQLGLIALDEARDDDELQMPAALAARLALHLCVDSAVPLTLTGDDIARIRAAQSRSLRDVAVEDASVEALVQAAGAFGVADPRAALQALTVARAAALWQGRLALHDDDLALAVQLVLMPRATLWPQARGPQTQDEAESSAEEKSPPPDASDVPPAEEDAADASPLSEQVLEAALAQLPAGLLAQLQAQAQRQRDRHAAAGRSGSLHRGGARGRPLPARRGLPRDGARWCLVSTLRAAAPWQVLRRAEPSTLGAGLQVRLRADDLHVRRHQSRRGSVTVFVIDASGSSAMHRLAEAKGAVELLLADCYARRDKVAVIGFRGMGAELLLPPTRSLVRAKRQLAGLPGGGGTPLAAGVQAAQACAAQIRRGGDTPQVVLLTDGRANVSRQGPTGRAAAQTDALTAARQFAADRHAALVIDTSPQPGEAARTLAEAMHARYIALPRADARGLHSAIRAAT